MKIKTHGDLPEGELLDFTVVSGDTSIAFKGRTVYNDLLPNKQTVSGIQFLELSELDQNMLHNYPASLEQWPKKDAFCGREERFPIDDAADNKREKPESFSHD